VPISVVIPVRNEADTIGAILTELSRQTRSGDEIIVVDTGSTDETLEVARASARPGTAVKLLEAPGGNPGDARNLGFEHAENDWVALLDAGTIVGPGWLDAFRRTGLETEADGASAVCGSFDPVVESPFQAAAVLAYVPRRRADGTRGPSTASMLLHRDLWVLAGGFSSSRAGEDLAFFAELGRLGVGLVPAPEARIDWHLAPDWRATWRRFSAYSFHVVQAGLWRTWHRGLVRNLAVIGACVVAGFTLHPVSWLGVPTLYLARAARSARGKWEDVRGVGAPRIALFSLSMLLIAFIDLAATWGLLRWLAGREGSGE
jgi:glycosyltransferase involved in cell wall biosynthesis